MKKITLVLLLLITTGVSKSQTSDEKQAIAMLKTFYAAYMSEFSGTDAANLEKKLLKLRQTYCTSKCEKQFKKLVEETDGDPIINAQDSDAKWAKTLSVKRNLKRLNMFTVSYYYFVPGEDGKLHKKITKINLIVIKQAGQFKIDSIL